MIRLSDDQIREIEQHGISDFPNECCGVMLGDVENGAKIVRELRPLSNTFVPDPEFEALAESDKLPTTAGLPEVGQERRYLISADTLFRLLREERKTGRKVLGFYHSHPNHPAQPSVYDFKASHPWYTYIIVSIRDRMPQEMTAWTQDEGGRSFVPVEIDRN